MIKRLQIADFLLPGQYCHFARSEIGLRPSESLHCHDFHELFWIERGSGWHLPDGRKTPLNTGELVLVAPDDIHGFIAERGTSLRLVNLAFPSSHWSELRRRYLSGSSDPFTGPRRFQLQRSELAWLSSCTDELDAGDRSRAARDRLLLNLLRLIHRLGAADGLAHPPTWLSAAVTALADPARFRAGPSALVAHTGRSHEHVARSVRHHYATTPTGLVNRARMAWAAHRLATSRDTPLEVCLGCGLENLGHFYRLFRAAHAASPEAWRQRQRDVLGE